MFFVERAQQIADLVKAVTESIGAIARGSLGAAAQRVEDALARAIPVAIGFLAEPARPRRPQRHHRAFIQSIRKPVEQAIRWLIGKAVDLVKAAGKLLGIGKEEDRSEATRARAAVNRRRSRRCTTLSTGMRAEARRERWLRRSRADAPELHHPVFTELDVV